jgi:acyl carrier protein
MSQQEIEKKVVEILTKSRRDTTIVPTLDTRFEDLKLESLDVMCAVFDLEEEFNITIPDGAAQNMRCIRDVVDSITSAIAANPAGSSDSAGPAPEGSPAS